MGVERCGREREIVRIEICGFSQRIVWLALAFVFPGDPGFLAEAPAIPEVVCFVVFDFPGHRPDNEKSRSGRSPVQMRIATEKDEPLADHDVARADDQRQKLRLTSIVSKVREPLVRCSCRRGKPAPPLRRSIALVTRCETVHRSSAQVKELVLPGLQRVSRQPVPTDKLRDVVVVALDPRALARLDHAPADNIDR